MSPIELRLRAFVEDAQPLLKLVQIKADKWINTTRKTDRAKGQGRGQRVNITDHPSSINETCRLAFPKIAGLMSWHELVDALHNDEVFILGKHAFDAEWNNFDGILHRVLWSSVRILGNAAKIDYKAALRVLKAIGRLHSQDSYRLQASAALSGVKLRSKCLSLPQGITLYRLTREERNQRSPFLRYEERNDQYRGGSVEIRASIPVSLDRTVNQFVEKALDAGTEDARELFLGILCAVLLGFPGRAGIRTCELQGEHKETALRRFAGGTESPLATYPPQRVPRWIEIGKSDLHRLGKAFGTVFSDSSKDKTLSRALGRFFLGRVRPSLIDKLVDYVIAWESLLLTVNGSALQGELSYRFRFNGALLISMAQKSADRKSLFMKMKQAYDIRSTIVHGGTDDKVTKELKKGGFTDLGELCNFLEDGFRKVVFWLDTIDPKSRPYIAADAWETLHWSEPYR